MNTSKQLLAALCFATAAASAQASVTITIINSNGPGQGFNDPRPVAPIGGNNGTTLGEQRLIAFTYAANIWGANLDSSIPVRIDASFAPMSCTANSGTLGAAGAWSVFANFPNAPKPDTWYPAALANKLAQQDLDPTVPHIEAVFNSDLGMNPNCLPGGAFYLGLDNHHGNQPDLVAVLLHEMGHGLGFQTFTDASNGTYLADLPSVWDHYLLDKRNNKHWTQMSDAERIASAMGGENLVWDGMQVRAAAPSVLTASPNLAISGPSAGTAAGNYIVGDASFGPTLAAPGLPGQLMPVVDQPDGRGLACNPLNSANAMAVRGNIALVDRGVCTFVVKAQNIQAAGGLGMVVADNVVAPISGLGGSDASITIPSVRVTMADGLRLKGALLYRSRTASGVMANLGVDPSRLAGADSQQRLMMYAPNPFAPGSSVSHYTDAAKRNLIMEPFINGDLMHTLSAPYDLTLELLRDIGW